MNGDSIALFSAFPRLDPQFQKQTLHGAIVTISGVLLAAVLFFSEMSQFISPELIEEMRVDPVRGRNIRIAINVTFPALSCAAISLDTADVSGMRDTDSRFATHMGIHKIRLDQHGRPLKRNKEYRPPVSLEDFAFGHTDVLDIRGTAQHIRDIDEETEHHEGCNVFGYIDSQKTAGSFHFTIHRQNFLLMSETQKEIDEALKNGKEDEYGRVQVEPDLSRINVSHTIHGMAFGPQFPGQINPLDGVHRIVEESSGTFKYFLKIVPTEYKRRNGMELATNQYSITEYFVANSPMRRVIPSVQFVYDISPLVISITQPQRSLSHFVVRLCAVIGGVFATTGLVDRVVNTGVHLSVRQASPKAGGVIGM